MRTAIVFAAGLAALIAHPVLAQHPIQFDVKRLTVDSNEGCDIADIDGDGKLFECHDHHAQTKRAEFITP